MPSSSKAKKKPQKPTNNYPIIAVGVVLIIIAIVVVIVILNSSHPSTSTPAASPTSLASTFISSNATSTLKPTNTIGPTRTFIPCQEVAQETAFPLNSGALGSISWNRDATQILTSGTDGTTWKVQLWDATKPSLTPLLELNQDVTGKVITAALSPDGAYIAVSNVDNVILVFDVANHAKLVATLSGHTGAVNSISWSPDGRHLASSSDDGTIRLWDIQTGASVGNPWVGHKGRVRQIHFSPDGTKLSSAGDDGTVKIWDVQTGQVVTSFKVGTSEEAAWEATWSPDGTKLATSNGVWNAVTGRHLLVLQPGYPDGAGAAAWSPDGTKIATAAGQTKGLGQATLDAQEIQSYSPVQVYDAASGTLLYKFGEGTLPRPQLALAWASDSQRLASAGQDGAAHIWQYNATCGTPTAK